MKEELTALAQGLYMFRYCLSKQVRRHVVEFMRSRTLLAVSGDEDVARGAELVWDVWRIAQSPCIGPPDTARRACLAPLPAFKPHAPHARMPQDSSLPTLREAGEDAVMDAQLHKLNLYVSYLPASSASHTILACKLIDVG